MISCLINYNLTKILGNLRQNQMTNGILHFLCVLKISVTWLRAI